MIALVVQISAAMATAIWAVALRGVSIDTQLSAFALAGIGAAIALWMRTPTSVPMQTASALALTLAAYQSLLYASFSPPGSSRAQVVVNLNFVAIMAYDALMGTETLTAMTALGGAIIIAATLCVVAATPPLTAP